MYRKIAYKILKEEYWNLVEGLDWIPSLHVRNMTSNLQRRLTDVLANIPNDQGIQKKNDKVYKSWALRNWRKTYWYKTDVSSPGISAGKSCYLLLEQEKATN